MKTLAYIAIIVAVVSIVIGIVLAAAGKQLPPVDLQAKTFMDFTKVCLLFAVAFSVVELVKAKK